jgi:hypothetical protein
VKQAMIEYRKEGILRFLIDDLHSTFIQNVNLLSNAGER